MILVRQFIFLAVFIHGICLGIPGDKKAYHQIKIPFGDKKEQITFTESDMVVNYPEMAAMDIDDKGNIYIADPTNGNTVIKKFSESGKYLDKIFLEGVVLQQFAIYKGKLYAFGDYSNSWEELRGKGSLYIFSLRNHNLIDINKHFLEGFLTYGYMESFDNKLVFDINISSGKSKFIIYDLETETFIYDLDSPYSSIDQAFLSNDSKSRTRLVSSYLGKLKGYYLFTDVNYDEEIYSFGLFKSDDQGNTQAKTFKIPIEKLGEMAYPNPLYHWRLKKGRWVYFMGWEEGNVLVNKIDLMQIFPDIYPDAIPRKYDETDIESKNAKELRLMRNEIFARHGRTFKTDWIREYFENQDWYKVDPYYNNDLLTEIDLYNIKFIAEAEQKLKKQEMQR